MQEGESCFIQIMGKEVEIKIFLTEENPNSIKSAFNQLINLVRNDDVEIKMNEVGTDLFFHVASEYISQLNREIQEVRNEMRSMNLIQIKN